MLLVTVGDLLTWPPTTETDFGPAARLALLSVADSRRSTGNYSILAIRVCVCACVCVCVCDSMTLCDSVRVCV